MTKVLFLALLVFLGGLPLQAFPMPPPLETGHLLGKGLAAGMPPVPLTDELYVLGWSRHNALAVLERRSVGARTWEARFRVYDLVEDRVLDEELWPGWDTDEARAGWWEARSPEIDRLFTRFQLEPTQFQLGEFPLIIDEEYDSLGVRLGRSPGAPGWFDRLEVVVHSTGRGLKTALDRDGFWRWAAPLGFVPSPFESRVALVLLVQPAGWLGTREPLRFLVSGTSLKAGFPVP